MADITQTGPVGLKGLKGLNQSSGFKNPLRGLTLGQLNQIASPSPTEYVGLRDAAEGVGDSRFDEGAVTPYQREHLQDYRYNSQSGLEQILNGAIKMQTTAATTALNGVIGGIWGIGQGIANAVDNDPKTNFIQGLWDNDFNRAMLGIQDKMEEWLPNYYSEEQQNSPWYSAANILSANFIGDKLLKNAGFTIGSVAAMAVPYAGWIGKGAGALSKVFGASEAVANGVSKFATGAARTLISASGEAQVEALQGVKDNLKLNQMNLDNARDRGMNAAAERYKAAIDSGEDQATAFATYRQEVSGINAEYNKAVDKMQSQMRDVGNSIYLGNIALLSLTNNLEFGRYIRGGFANQALLKNIDHAIEGKAVSSARDIAGGIEKGTLRAVNNATTAGSKAGMARILGKTAMRGFSESFEEGAQDMISDSNQLMQQAKLNKWGREENERLKKSGLGNYSIFASQINPGVREELADYSKAVAETWMNDFGSPESSGWQDVFLGALTGVIGTAGPHRNQNGKVTVGWQGGLVDAYRDVRDEYNDTQQMVDTFNKQMKTAKFRDNVAHAAAALSLSHSMDYNVQNDRLRDFKNREMMAVVNDALFFRNNGLIDAYRQFYKDVAANPTDDDVEYAKKFAEDTKTGVSPYEGKTNEQIKQSLKDKGQSTLNKIDDVIKNADDLRNRYAEKIYKASGKAKLTDLAAAYIASKVSDEEVIGNPIVNTISNAVISDAISTKSVIDDLVRRRKELEQEKQQLLSDETSTIVGTNSDRVDEIDKAINDINNNITSASKELKEMTHHPEQYAQKVADMYNTVAKYDRYKEAKNITEDLQKSTSIQNVADIYFTGASNIDTATADKALDDAINNADDDNKSLLSNFKTFISQVNTAKSTLPSIIDNLMSENPNSEVKDAMYNAAKQVVDNIIMDMASEKNPNLTKDSLIKKLDYFINENTPSDEDMKANPMQAMTTLAALNVLTELKNNMSDATVAHSASESKPDTTKSSDNNAEKQPFSLSDTSAPAPKDDTSNNGNNQKENKSNDNGGNNGNGNQSSSSPLAGESEDVNINNGNQVNTTDIDGFKINSIQDKRYNKDKTSHSINSGDDYALFDSAWNVLMNGDSNNLDAIKEIIELVVEGFKMSNKNARTFMTIVNSHKAELNDWYRDLIKAKQQKDNKTPEGNVAELQQQQAESLKQEAERKAKEDAARQAKEEKEKQEAQRIKEERKQQELKAKQEAEKQSHSPHKEEEKQEEETISRDDKKFNTEIGRIAGKGIITKTAGNSLFSTDGKGSFIPTGSLDELGQINGVKDILTIKSDGYMSPSDAKRNNSPEKAATDYVILKAGKIKDLGNGHYEVTEKAVIKYIGNRKENNNEENNKGNNEVNNENNKDNDVTTDEEKKLGLTFTRDKNDKNLAFSQTFDLEDGKHITLSKNTVEGNTLYSYAWTEEEGGVLGELRDATLQEVVNDINRLGYNIFNQSDETDNTTNGGGNANGNGNNQGSIIKTVNEVKTDDTDNETDNKLKEEKPVKSYKGNAYLEYEDSIRSSKLDSRGVARKRSNKNAKELFSFLESKGINIHYVVNYVMHRLMSSYNDGKLPVHYMMARNNDGTLRNKDVFLVTDYNAVKEVLTPEEKKTLNSNIIKDQNGKEYLIVGLMGYRGTDNRGNEIEEAKPLKDGHNKIKGMLSELSENYPSSPYVVGNLVNKIYDINPGSIARRSSSNEADTSYDINELMQHPETNPMNLTAKKLKWMVIEGEEGDTTRKYIGLEDGASVYDTDSVYPGTVFLLIPASNGHYVPQRIDRVGYGDFVRGEEFNKNSTLWNNIQNAIRGIAEANDTASRELALSKLRELLTFNYGNNLYFQDETDKMSPNTLKIRMGNKVIEVINFNDNPSVDDVMSKINDALTQLNTTINVSTTTLANSGPSIYLDAGIIRGNIKILGTVNSQDYMYPIDSEGKMDEKFVPIKGESPNRNEGTHRMIFLNSNEYFIDDEGNYYNAKHEPITDTEEIQKLDELNKIINDLVPPTVVNSYKYWEMGDRIYANYKGNGYFILNNDETASYRKAKQAEINKKNMQQANEQALSQQPASSSVKYNTGDKIYGKFGNVFEIVPNPAWNNESHQIVDGKVTYHVKSDVLGTTYTDETQEMLDHILSLGGQAKLERANGTQEPEADETPNDNSEHTEEPKKEDKPTVVNGEDKEAVKQSLSAKDLENLEKNATFGTVLNNADFDLQDRLYDALAEITGKELNSSAEVEELLKNSKKEAHGLYLNVKDEDSLEKLIEKIKSCGI